MLLALLVEVPYLSNTFPRYNQKWTRHTQDAILTVLLTAWIGGMATATSPGELGRLLTLEQVGEIFQGPFAPLPSRQSDTNPPFQSR